MFAYVPWCENRASKIIDDDLDEGNDCEQVDVVRIMLNLGYMDESLAKDIKFKKGFSSLI